MCGLFGFITRSGDGPDLDCLKDIATETQVRGDHAFGLAWLSADGRLHTFKRPGPATDNLDDLDQCRDARIVIGHCRWATHGTPEDNRNNHPHRAGRGWLVHNGVVRNHAQLIRDHRLTPRSACDSEVLGLLMAQTSGTIALRAARTALAAEGPLALLGVWAKPARLLVVRNGNPLWLGETRSGGYFGSRPGQLPGRPRPVPDAYASVLTCRSGMVDHDVIELGK